MHLPNMLLIIMKFFCSALRRNMTPIIFLAHGCKVKLSCKFITASCPGVSYSAVQTGRMFHASLHWNIIASISLCLSSFYFWFELSMSSHHEALPIAKLSKITARSHRQGKSSSSHNCSSKCNTFLWNSSHYKSPREQQTLTHAGVVSVPIRNM